MAWAAHRKRVEHLLPEQSTIFNLDQFVSDEMLLNKLQEARRVRGLASLKFLWREFFIPLASSMVPGVEAAIDAFQPDALLVDQQALAGAIVARQRTLPWATIATTSATLADPFRLLPTVQDWVHAELAQLHIAHGLPPSPEPDLSPDCVIVCSTREFVGESAPAESRFAWVGPAVMAREDHTPFPMEFLEAPDGEEERPVVLVSLGTLNAERGKWFYQVVVTSGVKAFDSRLN